MDHPDLTHPTRAQWLRRSVTALLLILIPVAWLGITVQPSFRQYPRTRVQVDADRLRTHVVTLSEDYFPRSTLYPDHLDDTAFMRNSRYHRPSDTAETLDYDRMAQVVCGVYEAVMHLTRTED